MRGLLKNKKRGYTLVEMLAAIVVLTIMGIGLVTGLQAASNSYKSLLFTSNSDILEDTINTAFSDTLRYATDVYQSGSDAHFTSDDYAAIQAGGHAVVADDRIKLVSDSDATKINLLISEKAYAGLKVTDFTLSYNATTGIFTGSYAIESNDGQNKKSGCGFNFRNIEGSN